MSIETPTDHSMLGYARVSTLEQDEALQVDALRSAGCARVFVDKASGKLEHRPALDCLLDQLRPGDTLTVWRLDRLGRSLRHLIDTLQTLDNEGVAFRSLTESIDLHPRRQVGLPPIRRSGRVERDLIRERTMAGLAAARARGRKGGRRSVWTPEKLRVARSMYESREHDVAAIARVVGVSRASVYRALSNSEP